MRILSNTPLPVFTAKFEVGTSAYALENDENQVFRIDSMPKRRVVGGGAMDRSDHARKVLQRLGGVAPRSAAQIAEAVAVFAPLGWAMCMRWHQEGTLRALRHSAHGAESVELDELITDVWNKDNSTALQHAAAPIRQWANSYLPFKKVL